MKGVRGLLSVGLLSVVVRGWGLLSVVQVVLSTCDGDW